MPEQDMCVMYTASNGWLIVFEVWQVAPAPPPNPVGLCDREMRWLMMRWLRLHTNTASHFEDDSTHIFTLLSKRGRKQQIWVTHTSVYAHHILLCFNPQKKAASMLHDTTTSRQTLPPLNTTTGVATVTSFHGTP